MPSRYTRALPLVPVFAMACLQPVLAQDGAPSHPCAEIGNAQERLACYDRAFPLAPEARDALARNAEAEFGKDDARRAAREEQRAARESEPDSVQAVVASVSFGPRQERVISLDNGQVWAQTELRSSGLVREGDTVTVRKAAFGTYMLSTGSVALRVRRVR